MTRVALHWLRRDLRLTDNPALRHACEHADEVVLAFIHAPNEEAPWQPGAASNWWLHHSLESFGMALARRKLRLIVRRGPSLEALRKLIRETDASLVTWNRLYEPALVARDTQIKSAIRADGVDVHSANAALLFEPWDIRTQQSQPYKVFTPFWRTCASQLAELAPPQSAYDKISSFSAPLHSETLDSLGLRPTIPWDREIHDRWRPGEDGALRALDRFMEACDRYPETRDLPAVGTSCLSPHLHFGEIGPRQIVAALRAHSDTAKFKAGRDAYVRELGWREFAHHVLYHFPHTATKPFDSRFEAYPWQRDDAALRAWQRGMTGFPIVDAGMRELWRSGYMHNRVRMLAASLLTKNLRIHWLEGARWFWDTLVDADLANNSLGWQWTAGCGTDAAPYFRIFNPTTQSERFDPEGVYLRRWLPELAPLPQKWLHSPHNSPGAAQPTAIEIGRDYPLPIVDLRISRDSALAAYQRLRTAN